MDKLVTDERAPVSVVQERGDDKVYLVTRFDQTELTPTTGTGRRHSAHARRGRSDTAVTAADSGFITTKLDADNRVFWPRDYSGIVEVSMDDGRRFRLDVVNGFIAGGPTPL